MQNFMNSIQVSRPESNTFDLTHDLKMSGQMGWLYPVMNEDVLPGDKISLECENLIRFAPLIAPIMHRVDVSMHYFFVPLRILWENFETWITNGGPNPLNDPIDPLPDPPTVDINAANYAQGLADYLGIPIPIGALEETIRAFDFSAYQCIWNEYYRDQNLQATTEWELTDGDNTANPQLFTRRLRCWEKDYYTAALPFAQKGAPVSLPIAGFNDVRVFSNRAAGGTTLQGVADDQVLGYSPTTDPGIGADGIYAATSDLTVNSASINDLRTAIKLQEWLEKNARAGSRYKEMVKAHYGIDVPDSRLQRPEYITGTKTPVTISEVLNTTGPTGATDELPQGNMAGHGISVTNGKYGTYFATEHGIIMGIMSVMPKTAYQQGLNRKWLKANPVEYGFPEFANLGEQNIMNKEVFAFQGAPGTEVFGYIPRYGEYKTVPNRVAGEFRTTLNIWTLARIFAAAPALNEAFVEADPSNRIFAVVDGQEDNLWCHILNKLRITRKLPIFGTPTF